MDMMLILHAVGLVAVATLFGSMAFFSGVVAPLVFVNLDVASAGRFLRGIFPWYYLVIALLSAVALASLMAIHPIETAVVALIGLGALVSRQVLMPRINHHRDRMLDGDEAAGKSFNRLHSLSVWINGAQLLAALVVLVRLALA